jgi:hypothetical protein
VPTQALRRARLRSGLAVRHDPSDPGVLALWPSRQEHISAPTRSWLLWEPGAWGRSTAHAITVSIATLDHPNIHDMVILRDEEEPAPEQIVVIPDFAGELKRRVPARGGTV